MERNMDPVKPRRRYDATQRRAQSRAARRIVLATAGQLFAERGYQRTSMKDIAAGAGVSVETVYGYFGTKAGLLKELLDVTVAGDDAPVSVPDRAPIQAVRAAPDGRAKLAHYAAFLATVQARLAPLFLVIRGAAGADQDAADLWAGLGAQRLAGMTMLAEHLAESGVLASGRSVAGGAGRVVGAGCGRGLRAAGRPAWLVTGAVPGLAGGRLGGPPARRARLTCSLSWCGGLSRSLGVARSLGAGRLR